MTTKPESLTDSATTLKGVKGVSVSKIRVESATAGIVTLARAHALMDWLSISCLSALTLPSAALTLSLVLQETDQQAPLSLFRSLLCLP